MLGVVDDIDGQILQEPESMEQFKKMQMEILDQEEERNDDEGEAGFARDEDLEVGGEGEPRLKKVLRLIRPVLTLEHDIGTRHTTS